MSAETNPIYTSSKIERFPKTPSIKAEYHRTHRKVMGYRAAFLSLGLLFTFLSALLFFKVPSWNFSIFFGYGIATKTLISLMTASFGLISLWLGCHSRTEFELAKRYYETTSRRLFRSYQRKRAPFHLATLITASAEDMARAKELRLSYEEQKEELEMSYENTYHLLDILNHSPKISASQRKQLRLEYLAHFKQRLLEIENS